MYWKTLLFAAFLAAANAHLDTSVPTPPVEQSQAGRQLQSGVYDGDLRLAGGRNSAEGRLEVYYRGTWTGVCDDQWDDWGSGVAADQGRMNALVACRQLGYTLGEPVFYSQNSFGGYTNNNFHIDGLTCNGDEWRLEDCQRNPWDIEDCSAMEAVGVRCFNEGDLRLMGGAASNEGRLEVASPNGWKPVCDDGWDDYDTTRGILIPSAVGNRSASVACRQLGYPLGGVPVFYSQNAFGGNTQEDFGLDDVACVGTESRLEECRSSGWESDDCGYTEAVGVRCTVAPRYSNGDVRLSGGSSTEGRLEVYYNGVWGPVCDDFWDEGDYVANAQGFNNAKVACRQLGYSYGIPIFYSQNSYGGNTNNQFPIDDLRCTGTETRLDRCNKSAWNDENCGAPEAIGVKCSNSPLFIDGALRLVGGRTLVGAAEGRLESFDARTNSWYPVCDDEWTDYNNFVLVSPQGRTNANTACRILGYTAGEFVSYATNSFGGNTNNDFIIDNLRCQGYERNLLNCQRLTSPYIENCFANEAVGLRCSNPPADGTVRLVGGPSAKEGRVEMARNGTYWPICDDGLSTSEGGIAASTNGRNHAATVCRQLGYTRGGVPVFYSQNRYGGNTQETFVMDDVVCSASATRLDQCGKNSNTFFSENCSASEAIGVRCT